jgi:hypothetical protein
MAKDGKCPTAFDCLGNLRPEGVGQCSVQSWPHRATARRPIDVGTRSALLLCFFLFRWGRFFFRQLLPLPGPGRCAKSVPTSPAPTPASSEQLTGSRPLVHKAHLFQLFFVTFDLYPVTLVGFDETNLRCYFSVILSPPFYAWNFF